MSNRQRGKIFHISFDISHISHLSSKTLARTQTHEVLNETPWFEMKNEKWCIQLTSATVEFVFAPEERDVYSYERTPKGLAPIGAKPGSKTFVGASKKRLRSYGASEQRKNR